MNRPATWKSESRRYLRASIDELWARLADGESDGAPSLASAAAELERIEASCTKPPAARIVVDRFGLSAFERDVLVMCAGVEFVPAFARWMHEMSGRRDARATFGVALERLDEGALDALTPGAPLRRWKLVTLDNSHTLATSPARVDERVLHFLAGIDELDERLQAVVEPYSVRENTSGAVEGLSRRVAAVFRNSERALPVVQLHGRSRDGQLEVAARSARELGCRLFVLDARAIPTDPQAQDELALLWDRESVLSGRALAIEMSDDSDASPERLAGFVRRLVGPVFTLSRDAVSMARVRTRRFEVVGPSAEQRRTIWRDALGEVAEELDDQLDQIATQFEMGASQIRSVAAAVSEDDSDSPGDVGDVLWRECVSHGRPRLEELAQRIEPSAGWDDLVLPDTQKDVLHTIAAHVRGRMRVYQDWGFAGQSSRGLGIAAIFAGESGTGKTMAAEVLAGELDLDLFRIDLSSVVSKYIGETEKNLRRIFDAAEGVGAILLFDEADALFGKRSDVKDSHDRYANLEVSYLLQRMEAYRGLAVLTTNLKDSIDSAFSRRIRFILDFPFPDTEQRAEIWRRVFPEQTPVGDLDFDVLAGLNITGGSIRNIALNAAFLAADADAIVQMRHLESAARAEYTKLGRYLDDADFRAGG